jgi:predicted kinase
MSTPPSSRSVKIGDDERTGWSSDRPRGEGRPPRPPDVSVNNRVLAPADRLRYSPGSLLMIVSASPVERDRFAQRVIEDRASLLSLGKVRGLLAGKLPEDQIDAKAGELLDAAVTKRIAANETVVVVAEGLEPEERERYVRIAAQSKRPRHLILLEAGRDQVQEEDRGALNELRRALDAGELGGEGFHTALRLGGGSVSELKRILFRPAPRDD